VHQVTNAFARFVESERAGGILLIGCAFVSLAVANSPFGTAWLGLWGTELAGLSFAHWVNDALMAVFFLLVGLELEREIYAGELTEIRTAPLPIAAEGVPYRARGHR
jgi:NhaA family Na+:H+ antiporter